MNNLLRSSIAAETPSALINQSGKLGWPIKLTVLKSNPAKNLYERLNFRTKHESDTHYEMWRESTPDE